ncbi:flagellar hook-basal body complex protein FliE [Methylomonas sp. MED-D]|uniref:Flagellar hook-basal body complex protein FliE n=1 Tax=Methylomonas koyamae TaxID=702114 RepID=A0A177NF21_9GAMM|nr:MULTISPECIES: flagellar hook-basal body complex protein FliE [Methylomonas]NJA07950.1 flagellar hook-basal body complex protein FliE [Methylococcaceae bacterium WWC4]MDT4329234.1 flagellar hook-basal body complex protein FliE [Methylomonas sp. MV1]OAI16432.1 flagellar hook-basal body protein FliE [Methylomonas koyamae]OHX36836.1 flagellar hook-basal body complex protein FliE [Methylomonas sp. LWB]WGS87566.1 flagellar hook-basal body complex protein FliE [Methylomonas sp. UP202]
MSDMNINQVLAQMRTMSIEAGGKPPVGDNSGDFAAMLKQSIDSVNRTQQTANDMAQSFEMGKPDVSLAEVMIASQKASVSFQAMLQVRNKLVDAYKDVMGMSM